MLRAGARRWGKQVRKHMGMRFRVSSSRRRRRQYDRIWVCEVSYSGQPKTVFDMMCVGTGREGRSARSATDKDPHAKCKAVDGLGYRLVRLVAKVWHLLAECSQ
jgi:hypothetical protein